MGRPRGRRKNSIKAKELRIEFYSDMPSSKGGVVSGAADQYGRILESFVNIKGENDIRPTGHCIAANH